MNDIHLTKHASRRANQRGVPKHLIATILQWGDRETYVGSSCVAVNISRRRLCDPAFRAEFAKDVERLDGLSLILAEEDGAVVTVLRDNGGRTARRYRSSGKVSGARRLRLSSFKQHRAH